MVFSQLHPVILKKMKNSTIAYLLIGVVGALLILNGYFMFMIKPAHNSEGQVYTQSPAGQSQQQPQASFPVSLASGLAQLQSDTQYINISNYTSVTEIEGKVFVSGTPFYGSKLGVSFNDAADAANTLANLDNSIPTNSLTQDQLHRYIRIGTNIACFYCCGATTLVDNNGNPACSCNHSMAIRGLAKWLIINTNMTNDQILLELNKWKALFFPGPTLKTVSSLAGVNNGSVEVFWLGSPSNIPQGLINALRSPGASTSGLPAQIGGCS